MKIAVFAVVALLSGCAMASDIIPLGHESYSVTAGSHSLGPNGLGATRATAVKSATAYCRNRQMVADHFDDSLGINTYATTLTFHCEPVTPSATAK
jgi:hypothetical protein